MIRKISFSVLSVLLILTYGCKQKQQQGGQNEQKQTSEKIYNSEEGHFKANYPGKPDVSTEVIEEEGVGEIKKLTASYAESALKNYTVVYAEYPEGYFKGKDPIKVLKGSRDGIIKNLGGRISGQKEITSSDYPGYMFKVKSGNQYFVYNLSLYKNRLYQVWIMNTQSFPEDTSFLESFEIVE